MLLPTYFLAAVLYTAVAVFGVGLALTSWIDRGRRAEPARPAADLLLIAAVGLYWNSVVFIGLFLAKIALSRWVLESTLLADVAVIGIGALFNRSALLRLWTGVLADGLTLAFLLGGALLGAWAMLEFPHVLDSGQILWTQEVLDSGMGRPVSAMMGYSALVGLFGALFPASPVVMTAAAFKPLLLGLSACLAVVVADVLTPRHRALTALSFFLLCVLSTFGTYGLLELGKDSMWGILFATAFFATLCREDAGRRGIELALYFTVASTLGVIALPYMVVAYGLWLLSSAPEDGAADTVPAVVLINLPVMPTVLAGFLNAGLGRLYVAYAVLAVAVLVCHRIGLVRRAIALSSRALRRIRAFLPLVFAVPAVLLFPVALAFPVWVNADGTVVTETRAPLDGVTSFFGYMLALPVQNVTVALGLLASLVVGFTPFGRQRPGLVAVAAMPALVLVLALTRAHLHLPIISDFNVWDMVKDIPQWFGGTLLVLVLLGALLGLSQFVARPWLYPVSVAVVTCVCAVAAVRNLPVKYFERPITFERYSAYSDADMAKASSLVWERLKGRTIWVDASLPVARQYFYSFQMYGGRPSFFDPSKIKEIVGSGEGPIGFIISDKDLLRLAQVVKAERGSIEFLGPLSNGEAGIFLVKMDYKGDIALPSSLDAVMVSTGHYALEEIGDRHFYWMRANAKIDVVAPDTKTGCVSLSLFDPGLVQGPHIITLKDGHGREESVDIAGHTPESPAVIDRTLLLGDEAVELSLVDQRGEESFSGDARRIAFGLLMPMKLTKQACTAEEIAVLDGHYDREEIEHKPFYWMRSDASLVATSPGTKMGCISLPLFETGLTQGEQIVTLKDRAGHQASVDVKGHTSETPVILSMTLAFDGRSEGLSLTSSAGEGSFPDDPRRVAFGLLLSAHVSDQACSGGLTPPPQP